MKKDDDNKSTNPSTNPHGDNSSNRLMHERCMKHPFLDNRLERLEDEKKELWDTIGAFMPSKTILTIHGIIAALYTLLFSVSIGLNMSSMDRVEEARQERQKQIKELEIGQRALIMEIVEIKSMMRSHNETIIDMKQELKSMKKIATTGLGKK